MWAEASLGLVTKSNAPSPSAFMVTDAPSVLCELNTITGTGCRRMISFSVSMPFMPGISRSSVTTFGFSSSIFFRQNVPSIAVPTTSMDSSAASICGISFRISAESSTTSTRTAFFMPGLPRAGLMARRMRSVCVEQQAGIRLSRFLRPPARHVLHHRGQVEDQHHASVAQDRSAGDQIGRERLVVQCLDDQFFFAFQRVDNQAVLPLADHDDQHKELGLALVAFDPRRVPAAAAATPDCATAALRSCRPDGLPLRRCAQFPTTAFSGMAYSRCSTQNSSALMMARVSGSFRRNVVPCPGRVSTLIEAFSRCSTLCTTSIPTPRPETSVTCSAVLKPGRKMKSRVSASVRRAASSGVVSPSSMALARIFCASMPRPSSVTSTTTWLPW